MEWRPPPEALGLLVRYGCGAGCDELTDPVVGKSVSDHIIDLAALVLGTGGD
jgi:hypothetical protein